MKKIDKTDKKILYELDLNCRQSNTHIGKKIGLSKKVVSYRIDKLLEKGVINNFYTVIDTFKLGYSVLRVYITFQYMVSSDIKEKIIDYFVNYKNSWVVGTDKSEIDLSLVIWVMDSYEFYQFWNKTLDLYEDYFAKTTISLYIQAIDYKKSYLNEPMIEESNRELYRITCTKNYVKIDEIDYKLLNEIAMDARKSLVELAEILGCSSQDVKYRINNLIKKEIIRAFRIHINYQKLQLHRFKVDIYLKKHIMRTPIFNYLKTKPYLQCINVAIGWADIEPEFVVEDSDSLTQIIDNLNTNFPNSIRKFTYWMPEKIHRERWLPVLY